MNIDYSVDSGSDSDINSFIDLVSNLFSGDSFLYLVEEDDDGISVDINSKANDHDSLSSVIGTTWESYKEDREDILRRRYASRRRKDEFKYYVNPLCLANVVYIDTEFRENEGSPLWEADVKYWRG